MERSNIEVTNVKKNKQKGNIHMRRKREILDSIILSRDEPAGVQVEILTDIRDQLVDLTNALLSIDNTLTGSKKILNDWAKSPA